MIQRPSFVPADMALHELFGFQSSFRGGATRINFSDNNISALFRHAPVNGSLKTVESVMCISSC